MKLNFDKIRSLEQKYNRSNSAICMNTLQQLIEIVINNSELVPSANYLFAVKTLNDLGVIIEDEQETKKVQQLNS